MLFIVSELLGILTPYKFLFCSFYAKISKTEEIITQNNISVKIDKQNSSEERNVEELTYKENKPVGSLTPSLQNKNKNLHRKNELTLLKVEALKLRHKNLLKEFTNNSKISKNSEMKKSRKQKCLSGNKENQEEDMADREANKFTTQLNKMEEENRLLKIQIAQLQAIIELNNQKNTQTHPMEQTTVEIPTENRFEALLDIDLEETEMRQNQSFINNLKIRNEKKRRFQDINTSDPSTSKLPKTTSIIRNNIDIPINTHKENNSLQEVTSKNNIHLEGQDPKDTTRLMEKELGLKNFFIKRINQNKHILHVNNIKNFTAAVEILKNTSSNFFTYTVKQNKKLTYILKGLHSSYSEDEILSELKKISMEEITFTKVSRLHTKKSRENNILLPIFIVQLSPDSKPTYLKNIKAINYQIVRWERLKKNDTIQCKRCQRIGRAAANCGMNYRCVKCEDDHGPGECTINQIDTDKSKLYCVNCKGYGHPASYRGCPNLLINKIRIREKESIAKENKQARLDKIEKYTNPNLSYANASKNKCIVENRGAGNPQNETRPNQASFNAELEITELKKSVNKLIYDQQHKWAAIEKIIKSYSSKIDLLSKNPLFKNG